MSQLLWSTLGIVCPTCDEHNAPRAAKCASCGTALLEPAAAPQARVAPPSTPPRAPAPERAPAPKPAAPAAPAAAARGPGGTNPRLPIPSPTGSNPRLPPPVALRPAQGSPGAPAPKPPAVAAVGAAVARSPSDSVVQRPIAPPVPPGMRPTSRPTPGVPLPAHELEGPPVPAPAPAPAPQAPARPAAGASKFGLLVIAGANAGQRFRLGAQGCQVGRSRGALLFPDDPFVSSLHATFVIRDGRLLVRDEGSASGVLVTVHQETLRPGALFSAGQRLFRYGGALEPVPPPQGRPVVYGAPLPQAVYLVEEMLVGGRSGRAVTTQGPLLTIGQSLCDLSFPGDEGMAARHCELSPSPSGAQLRDLSGGLGTFIHLSSAERPLSPGDRVRIGEQVLQVEMLA